jgi:hypothetical protein
MEKVPVKLGIGPSTPSSFIPATPGYCNGDYTILTPLNPGRPGFYYVAEVNWMIAVTNDSWSGVKSLYR